MGTRTARTGATLTRCRKHARVRSVALIVSVVPDSERRGLLTGVRVLDLSIWRPGPYATQLLVELDADVVKVEPPGGDPMRVFPTLFAVLNAGKRSAAVDLKDAAGKTAVLEAAAGADVVIEGFRPGVVRGLGLDDESVRHVNPNVVYCSLSVYGHHGPLAEHPGHDINYQSWAATLEPRSPDDEPIVPRPPIADLAGGAYAAFAVCAALVRRSRTGEGESIDVSMTDVLASWTGAVPPLTLPDGEAVGGRSAGHAAPAAVPRSPGASSTRGPVACRRAGARARLGDGLAGQPRGLPYDHGRNVRGQRRGSHGAERSHVELHGPGEQGTGAE